jgi:ferredoxin
MKECATCHLYIPALSTPDGASPPIEEPSEDELDMLSYALSYKDGHSRLGCQIKVTEKLGQWCADGGVIGLPRF